VVFLPEDGDEGEKDNVGIFQHLLRKVYCPVISNDIALKAL